MPTTTRRAVVLTFDPLTRQSSRRKAHAELAAAAQPLSDRELADIAILREDAARYGALAPNPALDALIEARLGRTRRDRARS